MSERQLGEVGTEMQWEDEHVMTWDLVLEPGQSSDWHQHTRPYVFIVTRPGRLKAEYDDGSSSERDYALGEIVQGQCGSIHRVTNVGDELYSNSIVEIKQD
jgi:quercetin dioxygenase-like cupin family protein